jgi:hypothetical protein
MLIREFSDLHWEHDFRAQHKTRFADDPFPEYWEPPPLDTDKDTTLILAGDLFNGMKSIDVIAKFNERFHRVLIVFGNHDYWGVEAYREFVVDYEIELQARFNNVQLLQRTVVEDGDYIFVGATLWTDMKRGSPQVEAIARYSMGMDFSHIKMGTYFDEHYMLRDVQFTPTIWMSENKKDLEYIKYIVENNKDKKIIVVTHHAPSLNSIHPDFIRYGDSNYFFASDYDEFILDNPNIKLWVHGHVHSPFDYMLGETRIVCNPRGYPKEIYSRNFSNTNLLEV